MIRQWHSRPSSLLRGRVLRQGLRGLVEAGARRRRDLGARVDDLGAGARLRARLLRAAVLRSVAHEGQGLGPALYPGGDAAHALRGGGADAAAVVPCVAVARRPGLAAASSGGGELGIAVHSPLVQRLLASTEKVCLADRGKREEENRRELHFRVQGREGRVLMLE